MFRRGGWRRRHVVNVHLQGGPKELKNWKAIAQRFLPKPVMSSLRRLRAVLIHCFVEYPLFKIQPLLNDMALRKIKKKSRTGSVRVVFFVTFSAMWKYGKLLDIFQQDFRFEPLVVICPIVYRGQQFMIDEMEKAYRMFEGKGVSVIRGYDKTKGSFLNVKRVVKPDIIFYTNPYPDLVDRRFYITGFHRNTLTCYVRYGFGVSEMGRQHHDMRFHNLLWQFFCETPIHRKIMVRNMRNRGRNVVVTGYPAVDGLHFGERTCENVWKNPNTRLRRIIWAPHFSIAGGTGLEYGTFLKYSGFMQHLLENYSDRIQMALKPHPGLRSALYAHPDWGPEKTDKYFGNWGNSPNGQVESGDYLDLFNTSDAMIMDSASFCAEYLYCGKPSLFIVRDVTVFDRFNEFGKLVINQHYHAHSEGEIAKFVDMVCLRCDPLGEERNQFYQQELGPHKGASGSENIHKKICKEIFN